MRKAPSPDENRKRAERLFDGESADSQSGIRRSSYKDGEDLGYDGEDSSDIECAVKKSAKRSAREYAMLLVSSHTYTEKGLWQKIGSKGVYSEEDISDAVEYVKGFGYVNDRRLAENAVQRLAEKCCGRSKICRYLASKGISEDIIDCLDFSEIDFVYYCKRLLDRYAGKPDDKIMRALLNAGYTYGEIAEAKRRQGKSEE